MDADADDLLERAARAEEQDIPTLDELKAELARALDELERRFPEGRDRSRSGSDRLRYGTLMLSITNLRLQLQHGDYRELPSEQSAPTVSWQVFLEAHPELTAPPEITDDNLIEALRQAIEQNPRSWSRGAASSNQVVKVAVPGVSSRALVVRTGKQLARLASQGHVVRLRQKWRKGRGSSAWSLSGMEIGEWWLSGYELYHD